MNAMLLFYIHLPTFELDYQKGPQYVLLPKQHLDLYPD